MHIAGEIWGAPVLKNKRKKKKTLQNIYIFCRKKKKRWGGCTPREEEKFVLEWELNMWAYIFTLVLGFEILEPICVIG